MTDKAEPIQRIPSLKPGNYTDGHPARKAILVGSWKPKRPR